MATQGGGEHRALEELLRDVRKESLAKLDWEALEGRLLKRVGQEPREPSRSPWFGTVFGVTAAAFAVVVAIIGVRVGLRSLSEDAPSTPKPTAARVFGPEVTSPLHGNALAAGDRVRTAGVSIRVTHRAHSSWVLAPDSAVTVVSVGNVVSLRLDSGSLTAEVTHAERSESFVVLAGATRVAVHGTRFQVQRRQGRVLVRVSEGVVAVSSLHATGQSDEQWLLHAPSRGDFSDDGSAGHVIASEVAEKSRPPATRPRGVRRPPTASARPAPESPSGVAAAPESAAEVSPEAVVEQLPAELGVEAGAAAELPAKPSIGDVEAGLAQVIDTLSGCFRAHMPARGDMRVTARTTLSLSVLPDGRVAKSAFEPPLAPNVSQCAQGAAAAIRFAASREGVTVTRILELRR
ncbi:MAG TPA: FecR domain-containing protein [Polyangiaceae bacterium]